MTITVSTVWIPIAVSLVLFIFGAIHLKNSDAGYFGDIGALFLGILCFLGILITWTSYYAVLYFLK